MVGPAGRHGRRVVLLLVAEKVGQTVAHVLLDRFEVAEDVGELLVFLLQVVQQIVDDKAAHFLVQLAQPCTEFAFPARHLVEHLLQPLLHHLDFRLNLGLGFFVELLEVIRVDDRAVFHGRKDQAALGADERQIALVGLLLQLAQALLLAVLVLGFQGLTARLVLFALKRCGERPPQIFHQVVHVVAQLAAHPRRQA